MSDLPFELYLVPVDEPESPFKVLKFDDAEDFEAFTPETQYRLALESIFRWTLRRDELTDAEIVRAIKKVSLVALEDV